MIIKLATLIAHLGDKQASELFGVSLPTAKSWRLHYRYPSRDMALHIIKVMETTPGGPMTFEGIYGE